MKSKLLSASVFLMILCMHAKAQNKLTQLQNTNKQKMKAKMPNKVMWFDIPTDNIDKSAEFYGTIFGWDIQPKHKEDLSDSLSFRIALTSETGEKYAPVNPGAINGGLVTREIGITQPTILIEVENIEEKIKEILAAGGKVLKTKVHLPLAFGYFAYVTDPIGNVLGLWEWQK